MRLDTGGKREDGEGRAESKKLAERRIELATLAAIYRRLEMMHKREQDHNLSRAMYHVEQRARVVEMEIERLSALRVVK